jgi:hypothetical protein
VVITLVDLTNWGSFISRHLEHANEYGENILHRCSEYGYTDPQPAGSKELYPHMPSRLMRVEQAMKRLSHINELRANVLRLWYCAPLKDDGTTYTKSELSRKLRINKGKFKAELRKGQQQVISMKVSLT